MILETSRLYLRPLSSADATQEYADWLNDPDVNRYLETRYQTQSIDSCAAFIEQMNNDLGSHLFGLFLRDGGKHIGNAKLGFVSSRHRSGEISLFLGDKRLWGKGLASEVVSALTSYGFRHLALERLEAGCYEDNIGSLRIFLKTGYSVEGFFRKSVVFDGRRSGCFWLGILKDEFS